MTKLERFIFKNNIYDWHGNKYNSYYFKILKNGKIEWFTNLKDYLLNRVSSGFNSLMPRTINELIRAESNRTYLKLKKEDRKGQE